MSRQAVNQQTPPLFLNQAQYNQLQRSFTDPLQRRITALEAEVRQLESIALNYEQQLLQYEEQAQEYRDTITELDTQLSTANRTITQQTQQITALQTRITELETQGSWPSNYAIITQDRTFTTSTILWFSFNGGYGGDYIATYTRETEPSYGYVQIPAQSESAIILFNSRANGFSLFVDGQYVQDITDVITITAEYNATSNNRILALY